MNEQQWTEHSFLVSSIIAPSANMLVRFVADDTPDNSVTEAGIDDFRIEALVCGAAESCVGDFNGDGDVDGADLGALLNAWGSKAPAFDLNGDGTVDGADLGQLFVAWGACP